jgi:hypothetical protein
MLWLDFRGRRGVWMVLRTAERHAIPLVSPAVFIFQARAVSWSAITRHSTTTSTGPDGLP